MRSLIAFTRKELLEHIRSGRLMLLGILFVLIGIMNPAIAKITPWMLETMADSFAESGMVITDLSVDAMDAWVQYFKNIPIALIAFALLESSVFTREFGSGSLVLSLTKGLERFKVVISKAVVLVSLWTVGYWVCFAISYGYTVYFWDNSIVQNLMFSVVCWYVFGLMVVALMVLFSVLSKGNAGVLCGAGGVVLVSYMLSIVPKFSKYLPTYLMDGNSLIYGKLEIEDYIPAMIITAVVIAVCFVMSIQVFNKKQL